MSFWECPDCGGVPGITWCCTSEKKDPKPEPAAPVKTKSHYRVEVDAGVMQMVINALRRDAAEGKLVRGEMADELERDMVRL